MEATYVFVCLYVCGWHRWMLIALATFLLKEIEKKNIFFEQTFASVLHCDSQSCISVALVCSGKCNCSDWSDDGTEFSTPILPFPPIWPQERCSWWNMRFRVFFSKFSFRPLFVVTYKCTECEFYPYSICIQLYGTMLYQLLYRVFRIEHRATMNSSRWRWNKQIH